MSWADYLIVVQRGKTLRFPGGTVFLFAGLVLWLTIIPVVFLDACLSLRTEVYSCAIKHGRKAQGQEHQRDFYEYEEFMQKK
jgi:hypothetical protein